MNKKKIYRELESFQETRINDKYANLNFTVVLVQPEHAGNVGSISRIMKNFNFDSLVIFNPIESINKLKSNEARGYAMHGADILQNAKIISVEQEVHDNEFSKFIKNFDLVIASTAKGKKYTNIKRLPIFSKDLSLPVSEKPLNIAILFGKESRGLTNNEISEADILIRIPTGEEYPTLNLSHACGIILYEIFKKITSINIGRGENPVLLADKEDRLLLQNLIRQVTEKVKVRQYREDNMLNAFKNVFERAFISKKELSLMMGLFTKAKSILKEVNPYEGK